MKKIIISAIVAVAVTVAAVLLLRGRLNMGMLSKAGQDIDLVVVNDSSNDISTAYKKDGEEIDTTLKAGDEVTGGRGFIRIYTAKKSGSYEVAYPFPRPAGSLNKVTLSQIVAAPQKETVNGELYEKRGMIGDIKVEYGEINEVD